MDIEAVQRAKSGDTEALEALYEETRRMVYFTALGIVGNKDDAEDLVQDAYIKAFQNLSRLQDERAFVSWLKTITVNISKNYLKKKKPMLFQSDGQEADTLGSMEEIGEDFLPQEYVDQTEKRALIREMVEALPDAQRTAVMLYYFDELPLSGVSKIMETSDGTTKSRLNYARRQIRAQVDEQEKKGNKLYAGIPVLTKILRLASQDCELPADTAKRILSHALQSAGPAALSNSAAESSVQEEIIRQASSSLADPTVGETGAAAGKAAAAKGLAAKIAGMTVKTKVLSLILAGVVLAGAGTAATLAVRNHNGGGVQTGAPLRQKTESTVNGKTVSSAPEEKAETSAPPSENSTHANDMALFRDYYNANFAGKAKAVFFADLTHDGNNEMLVTSLDETYEPFSGALEVDTIENGQPKKIFDRAYDTTHYGFGKIYLYRENGLDYLFEPSDRQPSAGGYSEDILEITEIGYDIYSLTAAGEQQSFKKEDYGETAYGDGRVEYDKEGTKEQQEQREAAVRTGMKEYAEKSKLLLKAEWSGDFTFPEGDSLPFKEAKPASPSAVSGSSAESRYAPGYLGLTLEELTKRFGSDYKQYGNYSGGAVIGYEDKRLPFQFILNGVDKLPTDKIVVVEVPDGEWADEKYKACLTLDELKKAAGSAYSAPAGNDMDESYSSEIKRSGYSIEYGWKDQSCAGKSWTEVWLTDRS